MKYEIELLMASEALKGALCTQKQEVAKRLEKARQRVEEAAGGLAVAEASYKELEDRMAAEGVTPATIGDEIAKIEAQLRGE